MIKDIRGIETIFGAIILISICIFCTIYIINLTNMIEKDTYNSIYKIEDRFNHLLEATVEIKYDGKNINHYRNLSLVEYIILITSHDIGNKENNIQLKKIIDFFFGEYDYWALILYNVNNSSQILAEKQRESNNEDHNRLLIEKNISDLHNKKSKIRLILSY